MKSKLGLKGSVIDTLRMSTTKNFVDLIGDINNTLEDHLNDDIVALRPNPLFFVFYFVCGV